MLSVTQRRRRRESGSTLIEFSFVILPLMAFLLMTMDVAWILFGWASIQEGAREGVRYAISCQVSSGLNASIASVTTINGATCSKLWNPIARSAIGRPGVNRAW